MGTVTIILVSILFLAAIFTGGYNKDFLQLVKKSTIWDWLTTVDHKKIGILYLFSGFVFFLMAGLEAILMRIQLIVPSNDIFIGDTYNELVTTHGVTMMFLVALPMFFGFMNFVVPLQIGARDVAFPFLNALGYWLFLVGGIILNLGWIFGGAPDAGWFGYPELSLIDHSPGPGMDYYAIGLQVAGLGTLIGGINFVVTIINMRAPGMTFLRMPLFTWTAFVTNGLVMFAFPAVTVTLLLLTLERMFGGQFFAHEAGGNTVVYEHLFWIFGHPEVYILILPAFGITSEVVSTFSKKRLFGYNSMVFATVLIGFLGFMVWVHHMFTVNLGPITNTVFAVASMAIAIPTGIKIFNWLFTMWGGQIRLTTSMLFATSIIPTFVIGGVTGIMVALPPADYQYHDSYFIVAHFHYVLVGGTILAIFAGLYYWWPKMFGKFLNERLGKWHFWSFLIGLHLTFFPQHFIGLFGMPRRVFTYEAYEGLSTLNLVSSIGSMGMVIGTIALLANFYVTYKRGPVAPADAWDGRSLEWSIASPPPEYNFAQLPQVQAYDAYWFEKVSGNQEITPAEPLGSIHMPSPSYLPILMAFGFLISGVGFIVRGNYSVAILGLLVVFVAMFVRSFQNDEGYHIDLTKHEHDTTST